MLLFNKFIFPSRVTDPGVTSNALSNENWYILSLDWQPTNNLFPSSLNVKLLGPLTTAAKEYDVPFDAVDKSYAVVKSICCNTLLALYNMWNVLPSLLILMFKWAGVNPVSKLVEEVGAAIVNDETSKGDDASYEHIR